MYGRVNSCAMSDSEIVDTVIYFEESSDLLQVISVGHYKEYLYITISICSDFSFRKIYKYI